MPFPIEQEDNIKASKPPGLINILQETLHTVWKFVRRRWIVSCIGLLILWLVLELGCLPFFDIIELKRNNPTETALMKQRKDETNEKHKLYRRYQHWVNLSAIPKDLVNAVIVAEDGTFWSHNGFDWYELQESIEKDVEELRFARGASTITQQLVKNLYLSTSKSPLRKLKEWSLTWFIEHTLTKSRILEIYLNVIEWGDGVYGAEAASQFHFDKSVKDLTRGECAMLAAIIPSPRRYRGNTPTIYLEKRTLLILQRMEARGW
jgi:monofunctional biosynthetic peptidoglycan transglycosylase